VYNGELISWRWSVVKGKAAVLTVFVIIFIALLSTLVHGSQEIKLIINEKEINFDIPPQLEKGRVLVPMRKIFDELDAKVHWDGSTGSISALKEDRQIYLKVGSREARIDDEPVALDVSAQLVKGRTLVPLRFISEALGADVIWNQDAQTVIVKIDVPSSEKGFIKYDEVLRIDFAGIGHTYSSLYAEDPEDMEKITKVVRLFNKALAGLGGESSSQSSTSVSINLASGKNISMGLNGDVCIYDDALRARKVEDAVLCEEIKSEMLKYFVEAEVQINSTEFRMGDEVTVKQDQLACEKVQLYHAQ